MTDMPTKIMQPSPVHEAFRTDLLDLLRKHAGDLSADAVLALSAYAVGQIIAAQDKEKMTPDQAMDLVSKNIQMGNAHALEAMSI